MTRRAERAAAILSLTAILSGMRVSAGEEAESGRLPGARPFPEELADRLDRALAAQGPDYRPRTEHLDAAGAPLYTNRLILESSPYLLQHAHNPVDWYPWSDEAFELARELDRPVFLSVGYSTCHWCHVMERESFEDVEVARYLNENYVAIKVDREERPDVDSAYMTAVQIMTGRGGWPMSVWLTPERQPFYGGTYFPTRDGDRGVRYGFLTLLAGLKRGWESDRQALLGRAGQLSSMIEQSLGAATEPLEGLPAASLIEAAAEHYRKSFDARHGGLARPPKFPSSLSIRLLLRAWKRTGEAEYLDMATLTLDKMAAGGLFDQVGGGFHRYSTDAEWLVPHFEKMLYDNALLAVAYVEGYQASGREEFAMTTRRILEYVAREMTSPRGGFYSATDADSPTPDGEPEEGRFFTWTPQEIDAALDPAAARATKAFYGVTAEGNFEGRNILHRKRDAATVAAQLGVSEAELEARLAAARGRLYEVRARRPPPILDDKILTSWNGLMISAFAVAGQTLAEPSYVGSAERAATFVLEELQRDGKLLRTWRDGVAVQSAFLDDYAFLIAGLIDLFQVSAGRHWLEAAESLQTILDQEFWDTEAGGYFLTGAGQEAPLVREKPAYDGAEPSGNSVALLNLLRLAELTTRDAYRARADELLAAFARGLAEAPTAKAEMLLGLDFRLGRPKEILIVSPDSRDRAEPFLRVLHRRFLPSKVVVAATDSELEKLLEAVPWVEGKRPRRGLPTAYVCRGYVCHLPTTDIEVFEEQLED